MPRVRHEFPSWSWTGYEFSKKYRLVFFSLNDELSSAVWRNFKGVVDFYTPDSNGQPRCLLSNRASVPKHLLDILHSEVDFEDQDAISREIRSIPVNVRDRALVFTASTVALSKNGTDIQECLFWAFELRNILPRRMKGDSKFGIPRYCLRNDGLDIAFVAIASNPPSELTVLLVEWQGKLRIEFYWRPGRLISIIGEEWHQKQEPLSWCSCWCARAACYPCFKVHVAVDIVPAILCSRWKYIA